MHTLLCLIPHTPCVAPSHPHIPSVCSLALTLILPHCFSLAPSSSRSLRVCSIAPSHSLCLVHHTLTLPVFAPRTLTFAPSPSHSLLVFDPSYFHPHLPPILTFLPVFAPLHSPSHSLFAPSHSLPFCPSHPHCHTPSLCSPFPFTNHRKILGPSNVL